MSQQHESGFAQSNVKKDQDAVPNGISNKPQIEVGECSGSGVSEQEPQLADHIEIDECSSSDTSEQEPHLADHIEIDECSSSDTSEQEPQLSQPHIEIDECSSSDTSEQEPQLSSQPQIEDDAFSKSYNRYPPLINAAQRGDWKSFMTFIKQNPDIELTSRITSLSQTALHVAAISCKWGFILKLLELLSPESIALTDNYGNTILHYAAAGGSLKTAKALVQKNADLPQIPDITGRLPLLNSIWSERNKELAWYLSSVTKVDSQSTLLHILRSLIQSGYHDIALKYVEQYPESAITLDTSGHSLLYWLAENPSHFFSQSNLGFLERLIYKFVHVEIQNAHSVIVDMENVQEITESFPAVQSTSFKTQVLGWFKRLLWKANAKMAPSAQKVREAKLKHKCAVKLINHVCTQLSKKSLYEILQFLQNKNYLLGIAIKGGIEEIVRTLLQHFPDLIYYDAVYEQNILQAAIEYRQEKIVKIIKEISPTIIEAFCVHMRGPKKTTTLLKAGELAPLSISGAALQMQRELQWFKEVENITFPNQRERKNMHEKTAKDVFRKEHKELAEKGEKWMKDTANSCMLVSTLIATVLFAAAFTIPGGIINDKGIPIFLHTNVFTLFAISDTLGLFSSLTSLLMFLAILTSRYEVEDFLESLPKKLIIGLGSLFFAIAAMIIAFGAALTIILSERWHWVYVPVAILASFPVTIFVMLQLPLFVQMVQSTYRFNIFRLDRLGFDRISLI